MFFITIGYTVRGLHVDSKYCQVGYQNSCAYETAVNYKFIVILSCH